MAANRILVSSADMMTAIQEFQAAKNDQTGAFEDMKSRVDGLDSVYTGDAAEAFKSAFDNLYKNISLSDDKMQDAISDLTQSEQLFTQAEDAGKTAHANLQPGKDPFQL